MTAFGVVLLALVGGSGLVAQNALMLGLRSSSGSAWAALWANSLVGLGTLTLAVLATDGPAALSRLTDGSSVRFVLPGLFGTLYVYASLAGYARLGASATIALLVSSQMVAGVAFDAWQTGSLAPIRLLGVVCLVGGTLLTTR